eukprot:m.106941 g.106941  ORF g.106941 m.106941 type:complete len:477 (+) comp9202_c0_seq3:2026-3456(+)
MLDDGFVDGSFIMFFSGSLYQSLLDPFSALTNTILPKLALEKAQLGCIPGAMSPDLLSTPCELCPAGSYSPTGESCLYCPPGIATAKSGSTSLSQCNVCALDCNHGTCAINGGLVECHCHFGYSGSRCNNPFLLVVISLASIFAATIVAAFGVRLFQRQRSYALDASLKERLLAEKSYELDELQAVWQIDYSEISLFESIGHGAFGEVFRGRWQNHEVAVKQLLPALAADLVAGDSTREEFLAEASILQLLRHLNLVYFYGVGQNGDVPFVVLEYCARGSLRSVLDDSNIELTVQRKLEFARDASQGLSYLHRKGRIHRDVKSMNMLVTNNWVVKVADFGTARRVVGSENSSASNDPGAASLGFHGNMVMTSLFGSPAWMAPELLSSQTYDLSVDVYSFGIMLWEIATREYPYGDQPAVPTSVIDGSRPPVEALLPEFAGQFSDLMQSCWQSDVTARPAMDEVATQLEQLVLDWQR